MNTFETILKRRSIRKFKETKIEEEKIKKLLESAMAAPSAKNACNWIYCVVTNESKIKELETCAPSYNFNPPLSIVVCYDLNKTLTGVSDDFAVQDCSAAVENILLEAVELDLGAVWCGCYPRKDRVENVQKVLELDKNIIPLCVLQIGYPDETKEARTQYDDSKIKFYK